MSVRLTSRQNEVALSTRSANQPPGRRSTAMRRLTLVTRLALDGARWQGCRRCSPAELEAMTSIGWNAHSDDGEYRP